MTDHHTLERALKILTVSNTFDSLPKSKTKFMNDHFPNEAADTATWIIRIKRAKKLVITNLTSKDISL